MCKARAALALVQAAVVVAVVMTTAARRSTCRASLLLPPTGVSSDPPATATRPPGEGPALSARPWPTPYRFCCQRLRDQLVLRERSWSRIPAETRFTCRRAAAARPLLRSSAASQPRRPAPRRLPWRRLCDCVCVCIVCGATRAMRATQARGASTEPVECRKCSRRHLPHLADAVAHDLKDTLYDIGARVAHRPP